MNKNGLRQEFLKKRRAFIPFKKSFDQKIFKKFINLSLVKKAKTICFYVSKVDEVNTRELIKYYLGEKFNLAPLRYQAKKIVVVPKIEELNLILYEIKKWSNLSPGTFGVLEPKTSHATYYMLPATDVDLFIIPGLVFSKSGQRLGFGKGYYDRLLKGVKGFKLGLAYSWQIVDELPKINGDVFMDMIFSEKGILIPQVSTYSTWKVE